MCQRNHGAAFVTWFAIPPEALRVEAGADQLVRYASSAHGTRTFCRTCGSSLFCTNTEHPDRVDIPLAAMSQPIDRARQEPRRSTAASAWAGGGSRAGCPTRRASSNGRP